MPAAVRYQDRCTGHGKSGPRPNISASGDVHINGKGVHRVGDLWGPHKGHPFSTQATGSPNVYANGYAIARVGDTIACGSRNAQGSNNVFIN
jgi:uncharacterized Zn-binding protein involved in type VI secretion